MTLLCEGLSLLLLSLMLTSAPGDQRIKAHAFCCVSPHGPPAPLARHVPFRTRFQSLHRRVSQCPLRIKAQLSITPLG